MEDIIKLIASGLLSGSVISAVVGIILYRRTKRIEAEVKTSFRHNLRFSSQSAIGKKK